MSRRVTIPFHVSSTAAEEKNNGRFELPLDPPLDIGHTAHPTVYLNNLSFVNTFANIDKELYDNADLFVAVDQFDSVAFSASDSRETAFVSITLRTGNYSLEQLEREIAFQLYENTDNYRAILDHSGDTTTAAEVFRRHKAFVEQVTSGQLTGSRALPTFQRQLVKGTQVGDLGLGHSGTVTARTPAAEALAIEVNRFHFESGKVEDLHVSYEPVRTRDALYATALTAAEILGLNPESSNADDFAKRTAPPLTKASFSDASINGVVTEFVVVEPGGLASLSPVRFNAPAQDSNGNDVQYPLFATSTTDNSIDIPVTGGSGTGLTVSLKIDDGGIPTYTVTHAGTGYFTGDQVEITQFALDHNDLSGNNLVIPTLELFARGDAHFTYGIKPITLGADFERNRVSCTFCDGIALFDTAFDKSTVFTKVLGFADAQMTGLTSNPPDNDPIRFVTTEARNSARIDKTRAVAFHCPSLASGTYGTSGKHGDSQLAVVPITVGIGSVQSWETFEPIRIPSHVAGGPISVLSFFISNEEGELINPLGERFEAVMVVEYDVPLK